jgi:predicted transcriptional regulator
MGGACIKRAPQSTADVPQNPPISRIHRDNDLPPLHRLHSSSRLPTISTSRIKSCSQLIVDTTFKPHFWKKIDHTPTTEAERDQFLFYCPICMCYSEGGASCKLCLHHVCMDCAELIVKTSSIKRPSWDEMQCPHCRQITSLDVIKNAPDIVRQYINSPRTSKILQTKQSDQETAKIVNNVINEAISRLKDRMLKTIETCNEISEERNVIRDNILYNNSLTSEEG